MKPTEVIDYLKNLNDWRRGLDDNIQMLDPKEIGIVIYEAISY